MERYMETRRLILKPLTVSNAADVFEWGSDPLVNRYMCYPLYESIRQAEQWITGISDADLEFGFFLKSDGTCIGAGGIGPNKDGVHELGYNLKRAYWNQGYTTEAGKALIDWARKELNVRNFASCHAIENVASGRVIQKCGFCFDHFGHYSRFDGSETFKAAFYKLHFE